MQRARRLLICAVVATIAHAHRLARHQNYDATNHSLKYAYKDASGWHNQVVDSYWFNGHSNVGSFTSLRQTSTGWPAISYYDNTNGNLKYAYKSAS